MELSAGIAVVNVALLIALLTIYTRIYKSTRAVFTFGLMFFAGMLILHNIIPVYAYFAMEPLYSVTLLPYFLVVHLAELAGIAVLLDTSLSNESTNNAATRTKMGTEGNFKPRLGSDNSFVVLVDVYPPPLQYLSSTWHS